MKTLFWMDVHNKNPLTYDELVEITKSEIVSKKMIVHYNNVA